jgi:hypothetical protein
MQQGRKLLQVPRQSVDADQWHGHQEQAGVQERAMHQPRLANQLVGILSRREPREQARLAGGIGPGIRAERREQELLPRLSLDLPFA